MNEDCKRITEEISDLAYALAQLANLEMPCALLRERVRAIVDSLIVKLDTRLKQI